MLPYWKEFAIRAGAEGAGGKCDAASMFGEEAAAGAAGGGEGADGDDLRATISGVLTSPDGGKVSSGKP